MLLAALGTLSYNGYEFDGTSQVTVEVEFVKDEAQRTVLYHQHTINVRAVVADGDGTNMELEAIRRAIGEQGRTLIFINQGFGNDLVVNLGSTGLRDVKWGPKPTILSWEPIGSSRACEIQWQVVTCVPVCGGVQNVQTRRTGIMAMNYQISFSIDDRGYTTRVISGYLEIAQTRVGKLVPDTADAYLNTIAPTVPIGFRRMRDRTISYDKSRLDFTITDEQIPSPNAYPPGVVRIDGRHRVGWSRKGGLAGTTRNTISLDIEVAADQPASLAYLIFVTIAERRIRLARLASAAQGKNHVLIDEIGVEENLFGRSASFMISYRVTHKLSTLLTSTGLWTPIGTDWTRWHVSMIRSHDARGHAGLIHLPSNDAIVDLCGASGTYRGTGSTAPPSVPSRLPTAVIRNTIPSPDESWLKYNSWVVMHRDRLTSRLSVMQTPDIDRTKWIVNATTGIVYPPKSGADDVIVRSGRSRYYCTLNGYAVRAGYEIPRPSIDIVGISIPEEAGGTFSQSVIGNWLGVPIYAAKWSIHYHLPSSPGTVALPPTAVPTK